MDGKEEAGFTNAWRIRKWNLSKNLQAILSPKTILSSMKRAPQKVYDWRCLWGRQTGSILYASQRSLQAMRALRPAWTNILANLGAVIIWTG